MYILNWPEVNESLKEGPTSTRTKGNKAITVMLTAFALGNNPATHNTAHHLELFIAACS